MPIVQTINSFGQFFDAIHKERKNHFTEQGWYNLYNYLDELRDDVGENVEFDAVAFCCEYAECESIDEFLRDYKHALDEMGIVFIDGVYIPESEYDEDEKQQQIEQANDGAFDEELLELIRDYLESETTVVACEEDCIMFAAF